MLEKHLNSAASENQKNGTKHDFLSVADLERHMQDWIFEDEFRSHSPMATETRRILTKNLLWFLQQNSYESCGKQELKAFVSSLSASKTTA